MYTNLGEIEAQVFCSECGDGSQRMMFAPHYEGWSSYIIHKKTCSKYLPPPPDGMAAERKERRIRKTQYLPGVGRE